MRKRFLNSSIKIINSNQLRQQPAAMTRPSFTRRSFAYGGNLLSSINLFLLYCTITVSRLFAIQHVETALATLLGLMLRSVFAVYH